MGLNEVTNCPDYNITQGYTSMAEQDLGGGVEGCLSPREQHILTCSGNDGEQHGNKSMIPISQVIHGNSYFSALPGQSEHWAFPDKKNLGVGHSVSWFNAKVMG
jgi:hypothetical protein